MADEAKSDAADCWPPWFNEPRQSKLKAQLLDHNMAYQTLQQAAQGSKTAEHFKWTLEELVLKTALQFDGDVSVLWERSKAGHDDWWPPWFTDAVHAPLRALLRAQGYTYDQLHGWATSAHDREVFQGMLAAVLRTAAIPNTGDVAELWENIKTARPPTAAAASGPAAKGLASIPEGEMHTPTSSAGLDEWRKQVERNQKKMERKLEALAASRKPSSSISATSYTVVAAQLGGGRTRAVSERAVAWLKAKQTDLTAVDMKDNEVLSHPTASHGTMKQKHDEGVEAWRQFASRNLSLAQAFAAAGLTPAAQACQTEEHTYVAFQVNLLLACMLYHVQRDLGVGREHDARVGVCDTQAFEAWEQRRPDHTICHVGVVPSTAVAIGYNEVQMSSAADKDHVGKMGQYLKTLLQKNPRLPFTCGLIITETQLEFHHMTRKPNSADPTWPFEWTSSPQIELFAAHTPAGSPRVLSTTALQWLVDWAMCIVDLAKKTPPFFDVAVTGRTAMRVKLHERIGSGATSTVYRVRRAGDDESDETYALKVFSETERARLTPELEALRTVEAAGWRWGPGLVGTARGCSASRLDTDDGSTGAGAGATSGMPATADTGADTGAGDGGQAPVPPGPLAIVMHECEPLTHFNGQLFKELMTALFELHTLGGENAGWCHRDVRQGNLGIRVDGEGTRRIALLDFGAAVQWPGGRALGYHGTFHTASDAVLQALHPTSRAAPIPTPADDVVAAVRAAFLVSGPPWATRQLRAVRIGDHEAMLSKWKTFTVPGWASAHEAAVKVTPADRASYDRVTDLVSRMLLVGQPE